MIGTVAGRAGTPPNLRPADPAQPASEIKDGKGKWVPVFQRHADDYVITAGAGEEAKRLPDPLLRWWQPIRGGDDGALYLWVSKGRPVAAVTFFTFRWPAGERVIVHERHFVRRQRADRGNLAKSERPGNRRTAPGLTFKRMHDAPTPADTAPARLRQMQAMMREVSAITTDDKGSTWNKMQRSEQAPPSA